MKVDVWRRRRGAAELAACWAAVACVVAALSRAEAAAPLGPSDRPEAYFNGSSYIKLARPISLKQIVGLSFRTCVGGELFSQRFEGHTLHVTALFEQVVVSWARPSQPNREVGLPKGTLDNQWHWVGLRYNSDPPSLLLEVDKDTQVISNVTWNPELLSPGALEAGGALLLVGNLFSGCIHEGPQLEFHAPAAQIRNVEFGHCPLTTDECKDRKDVLRIPPKDHCYNEPCMRHGTCISRHDRYECHCSARYTGNNCEVDAGDPCLSAPCQHGARCVEDARGDYVCHCPPNYHGPFCSLEVSLDPVCVAAPCRNNGSCAVPHGADYYVCVCQPGYTGRDCETEVDECAAGTGAGGTPPCLHGGRCVDALNNYTCDCTGTGYSGARCESNVNECEDRSLCGHGVCYDTYGGYVCACQLGYTGEHCDNVSACASGPCGLGGACVEEGGAQFRCVCARGYRPPYCVPAGTTPTACDPPLHGVYPNCTTLEQVCDTGVCQNGATCSLTHEHFNCSCAPGYKGVYCEQPAGVGGPAGGGGAAGKALSELRVERCASAPCLHATGCVDLPSGGYRCECESGWAGPRCEAGAGGAACGARGCGAGGACAGGVCVCAGGWGGAACDVPLDCRAAPCPPAQRCSEAPPAWRCVPAPPAPPSPCAALPCHNGTCLVTDDGLFRCQCPPGFTGRFCEADIDECALTPKICNHGVCLNVPGSYECYCRPGYTGDSCEQDIDECLSSPCKNGGTCLNLENNYECTCMEGFEGKDCSVNIDECSEAPCAAGATCVDGVAGYSCVCQDGLTGPHCEIDIDDCESGPCQHAGRCVDLVGAFRCECGGTGYSGARCESDVDECAPQPCRNQASCVDDLNDYHCVCHPGYTGKNCETDIDECASAPCQYGGVCVQRSNVSLYERAAPLQLGPQPHMTLPKHFMQPFSYDIAAGFSCVCVSGTEGARCEVNVDECAPAPCAHGACVDHVGGYECDCAPGYEGEHCDTDIDECQRYSPCQHGKCFDGRASYYCACARGWGGQNCSVVLLGCRDAPCRHHGACHPWLRQETEHRFNCSCTPGHYGTTCEKITTMSLEKSSYAEVNTSREEGYDISFRFKTTLGSGLLAMGRGLTYFFLELSNGRLNLHSSLLNKWEGVFIGSNLNDSNWQKVFVTINSSHLVLAANEEQTIYPISQNEAYNSSVTSFPSTRLGTAGSSYATLTHGPNFFVGCFQDVVVNGQWVLPEESNSAESSRAEESTSEEAGAGGEGAGAGGEAARVVLRGVRAQCPRTPQCSPNPCRSGGACEDAWTSYVCTCPRPHLGTTCQYNYTAATFGQEAAARRSVVRVGVADAARRAVRPALDISMFVRTRKPTGQIFYLGSIPRYGSSDESQVGASLEGGELLVHLRFNQTPENYTVGGTRLDNGYLHLIEVVRNSTLVQVKLNGTEYFRKSISAAKQIDAQVLYLGGPPPPPEPLTTSTAPPTTPLPLAAPQSAVSPAPATSPAPSPAPLVAEPDDSAYFKGVIQDVQISNGVNVTIVEFFPLHVEGLVLPPAFGEVWLDPAGVLPGEVSDDLCADQPCHHNATCLNTWNDYTCQCPRGYKGKQCSEVEFCQLQGCPLNSHCRNLDAGYECVSNATFDGVNTSLTYQLRVPRAPPQAAALPQTISITYRSKSGGTLFHASLEGEWFTVGVFGASVSLQWVLGGAPLPALRRLRAPPALASAWTTLTLTVAHDTIKGSFAEGGEEVPLGRVSGAAWARVLRDGHITLGAAPARAPPTVPPTTETSTDTTVWEYSEGEEVTGDDLAGAYFKGCMGAVSVGGLLLPYFSEEELFVGATAALLAAQPHYALLAGRPWGASTGVGCVLCLERDCAHGGHCADVRSLYHCACAPGYSGDYCQTDIDECELHKCENGATCVDGVANYTCECADGFDGELCEHDIDECLSAPCQHGGTCTDGAGTFQCACAAAWRGDTCAVPRDTTCAHAPCAPNAQCSDTPPDPPTGNNFTCRCGEGFEGVYCERAFCVASPCVHGVCVSDNQTAHCECAPGYVGPLCARERDECVEAGAGACLHAGRCRDAPTAFTCDCSGTGYRGARCEVDVDECAEGLVSCLPGDCLNLNGSYTCLCADGFCGSECALRDPCWGPPNNTGPCQHGARCEQRCASTTDYICQCVDGWSGKNCTQQAVTMESSGLSSSSGILIGVGAALLVLLAGGAALGALAAQARRKRATRGTYSPSGQEYCNPRAEMMQHALKPPPEERLI